MCKAVVVPARLSFGDHVIGAMCFNGSSVMRSWHIHVKVLNGKALSVHGYTVQLSQYIRPFPL